MWKRIKESQVSKKKMQSVQKEKNTNKKQNIQKYNLRNKMLQSCPSRSGELCLHSQSLSPWSEGKNIGGIGQPHLANWRKKYWLGFHRQECERKISWLGFHHKENLPLPTKGHRRSSGNLTDLQKFWPPHQKKKSSNNNKYCVLCQRTVGTMHFWVEPFKSLQPKNYMCKDFSTEFCVQVKILLSHPRPHKKDIQ